MDEGTLSRLTVLGATTCEDTALVRSHLRLLGVPFDELDVDVDDAARTRLAELHGGDLITPTIDVEPPLAEPSLEALDRLLVDRGFAVVSPIARISGDLATRPIPMRRLPTPEGGAFSIDDVRNRRQAVLFLAHDATCLACFGFAKQLAHTAPLLREADAVSVVAVAGNAAVEGAAGSAAGAVGVDHWRHEIGPEVTLVVDDGSWKRDVLGLLGRSDAGVALVVLDRFAAPRAASFAPDAGGLGTPSDAAEWLAFVALDCPECSVELPWPS